LPGQAAGKVLLEERAIAVIPVPHLLPELQADGEQADRAPSLLLVGGVDFDRAVMRTPSRILRAGLRRQFHDLPGSRAEIEAIGASLRRQHPDAAVAEFRGAAATEEALRQQAGRYRYLHLATHGFFLEGEGLSTIRANPGAKGPAGMERIGESLVVDLHP